MRTTVPALLLAIMLALVASPCFSEISKHKEHDFIPKFHNIIFMVDVSDSMMAGHPRNYDFTRLLIALRAFRLFNKVMPHVPRWQYDLNAGLITYGDCEAPVLVGPVGPWTRVKYSLCYKQLRREKWGPWRTAGLTEALQLAGSLIGKLTGRTAIVVFTDGSSNADQSQPDECPQRMVVALKKHFGNKVQVFGVHVGNTTGGWRNLYETCKLSGGYARAWEDVRNCDLMKEFAWDILVREIMFPYPEIFFKPKSADIIPSEALKLEAVANFLNAIPQYVLQIDGHSDFIGGTDENYDVAKSRAENVKKLLVNMYHMDPKRVLVRSWGEELPRYDNQNPEKRLRNRQANLYLMLPLRNFPYNEKNLYTYGVKAVGDLHITQERDSDTEWATPIKAPPGSNRPIGARDQ